MLAGEIGCIVELYRDDVALSQVTECPAGVEDQPALQAGRSNFKVAMGDVRTARATAVSRCSLQRDAGSVIGLIAKTHLG